MARIILVLKKAVVTGGRGSEGAWPYTREPHRQTRILKKVNIQVHRRDRNKGLIMPLNSRELIVSMLAQLVGAYGLTRSEKTRKIASWLEIWLETK